MADVARTRTHTRGRSIDSSDESRCLRWYYYYYYYCSPRWYRWWRGRTDCCSRGAAADVVVAGGIARSRGRRRTVLRGGGGGGLVAAATTSCARETVRDDVVASRTGRRRRWRETGVSETCARQTTVRDWQSSARRRPFESRTSGRRTLPPRSPPPPNIMQGCRRRRRKALWGSSRPCGGQRAIAHARTCLPPRVQRFWKKSLDVFFFRRYHHCYRSVEDDPRPTRYLYVCPSSGLSPLRFVPLSRPHRFSRDNDVFYNIMNTYRLSETNILLLKYGHNIFFF